MYDFKINSKGCEKHPNVDKRDEVGRMGFIHPFGIGWFGSEDEEFTRLFLIKVLFDAKNKID
jgi:hypothetical protein